MPKFQIQFVIKDDSDQRYHEVYTELHRYIESVSTTIWSGLTSTLCVDTPKSRSALTHDLSLIFDIEKDYVQITTLESKLKTATIGRIPDPDQMEHFYEPQVQRPLVSVRAPKAGPPRRTQPSPNVLAPTTGGLFGSNALSQFRKG